MSKYKKSVRIFSWLLVASGLIWILQGVNILPGSFMTGQIVWARNGVITAIIGFLGLQWSKSK